VCEWILPRSTPDSFLLQVDVVKTTSDIGMGCLGGSVFLTTEVEFSGSMYGILFLTKTALFIARKSHSHHTSSIQFCAQSTPQWITTTRLTTWMLARRPLRSKQNTYTMFKDNLLTQSSNIKTLSGIFKPVGEPTVEDHAAYYANSKPPGRKYPISMASDMLDMFVSGELPAPPAPQGSGQPAKKKKRPAQKKK
jgi:hypothetical protein